MALLLAGDILVVRLVVSLFLMGLPSIATSGLLPNLKGILPVAGLPPGQMATGIVGCLLLFRSYGRAGSRHMGERRLIAAWIGVALGYWGALWNDFGLLLLTGFFAVSAVTGMALLLGRSLIEGLASRLATALAGPARILLIAYPHEEERARSHPALGNPEDFVVRDVMDPEILRRRQGAREALCSAIKRCDADTVALCWSPLGDDAFDAVQDAVLATGCQLVGLGRVRTAAAGAEPLIAWFRGIPLVVLTQPAWRTGWMALKRGVDILGGAVGLLAFGPLMACIACLIRWESSGPVIFAQQRLGMGGQRFRCLKFRSMRVDAEQFLRSNPAMYEGYVKNNFKLPEGQDMRVTRFGRFLRRTSLDELPQFWNIFRGDMSLVGPRPIVPDEIAVYGDSAGLLLSVKPGLIGAWAVNGRSMICYPARADMELGYVRQWRLGLDLTLLARAVPAVLQRRGAH